MPATPSLVWGVGDDRVIIDGDPQLTIVIRADVPDGTRADGGKHHAISWLATQKPGIYDGLDVPLHPPLPPEMEATRWSAD